MRPPRAAATKTNNESVAQLVEHSTFNRMVLGSSPSTLTLFDCGKPVTFATSQLLTRCFLTTAKTVHTVFAKERQYARVVEVGT